MTQISHNTYQEEAPSWKTFSAFAEHRIVESLSLDSTTSITEIAVSILKGNRDSSLPTLKQRSCWFSCVRRGFRRKACLPNREIELRVLPNLVSNPIERFVCTMMKKGLSESEISKLVIFSILWSREEFYDIQPMWTFCFLLKSYRKECSLFREELFASKPLNCEMEEWICNLQNQACDLFRIEDDLEINQAMTEICHSCYNLLTVYQVFDEMNCTIQEKKTVLEGIFSLASEFDPREIRAEIEVLRKLVQ